MQITKKDIRAITEFNFDTNPHARAIIICAKSNIHLWTWFLQAGALITFRRRFLHNELTEPDKKILELVDWATDEYGLPKEVAVQ